MKKKENRTLIFTANLRLIRKTLTTEKKSARRKS